MAFEIEVKAHVPDPYSAQTAIEALEGISAPSPIDKDDWYFSAQGEPALFRLRREAGRVLFTRKRKRMDGDIETNEEFEFETDGNQFDGAVAFVASLGYEVVAKKTKRGLAYSLAWGEGLGDLTIELCEVSSLGWFIELEFVLEERTLVEDAKRALVKALALLEIENSQLEGKPYLLLLSQITG